MRSKVFVDPESGCWGWTGALSGGSRVPVLSGVGPGPMPVRRYVWQLVHGDITGTCRVKAQRTCQQLCVNPEHLRLTDGSRARTA